jgi:hypothetical protein
LRRTLMFIGAELACQLRRVIQLLGIVCTWATMINAARP